MSFQVRGSILVLTKLKSSPALLSLTHNFPHLHIKALYVALNDNGRNNMGLFKMLTNALGIKKTQVRILIVGLDNSGKTTLVNHLKPKKSQAREVVPTIGFQVEEFTKANLNFTVFDMSGQVRPPILTSCCVMACMYRHSLQEFIMASVVYQQSRYRNLWENYYSDVQVDDLHRTASDGLCASSIRALTD